MKKEAGESFSIIRFIGGLYKGIGFWYSELRTRLTGVSEESWGLFVFENGITREVSV